MCSRNRSFSPIHIRVFAIAVLSPMVLSWHSLEAQPPKLPARDPAEFGIDLAQLDRIDQVVKQGIEEKKMPGAVVLIGHRGSIVYHKAFGNRQVEPEVLPMRMDTVFDLASVTKPMATATSIMILVERGVIRLRDKVAEHLPEFGTKGKDKVTIQQLLTHVGGLIPDNSIKDYEGTPEESIKKFLDLDLNYEPEKDFKYTDVGFLVLGELIKRKTGKTVHEFSQENIFRPLGMSETTYLLSKELAVRAATTEQREGRWMVGEVHDPRAYALGGIAGHAGLFGTATDLAVYGQMMLNRGNYQGVRILGSETIRTMTASYEVPKGVRGLGWDKKTSYSINKGETMSPSAFGHGGFTGNAFWIDPENELFLIFLSNRVHPNGKGLVNPLIGTVGTIAASAVQRNSASHASSVLCGIDVLVRDQFKPLEGRNIGLITNQTGIDRAGQTTVKRFATQSGLQLIALFSPEHGIAGKLDQEKISDTVDPDTGKPVFSLYGANRKPTNESLKGIDTVVFDIQDIGCRFYTYISTMGNAMEVAAQNKLKFVVLDRPNPIQGDRVAGPMLDDTMQSFVAYHPIALQHGMTVGEIAQMIRKEKKLDLDLQVIRCEGWTRSMWMDDTDLEWINPSPNMRNLNQAILYPGIGMLEYTNLSVGRGTDTPFEHIGAPWLDAKAAVRALQELNLPGVRFMATTFTPNSSKFKDQACQAIRFSIVDRSKFNSVEIGLAVAMILQKSHSGTWETKQLEKLVGRKEIVAAIERGADLKELLELSRVGLSEFIGRRAEFLLY